MQRPRRFAAFAAVIGLLAMGGITAGVQAARANVAGFCDGSGAAATCTVTETIKAATTITVGVTATTNGQATVNWTATCTLNGTSATEMGGATAATPLSLPLEPLPATVGGSCVVQAAVSLPTSDANNAMSVAMTFTTTATPSPSPSASATPTPAPSGHVVQGYASKCVDDKANSSANGAKAEIWSCNGADKAQLWTYSNGELIHNSICLNDPAWGGNRTKLILYTCNHALNELWTHLSNGEFVLNAKGYKLCLDDPANSTRNGTQLIIYTCRNSANQHWSKP
jgi:archaellum component FlaF (FlaF/FlaG flagellin family)